MPVAAVAGKVVGSVIAAKLASRASKGANDRGDQLSGEASAAAKNMEKAASDLDKKANDRWGFYKKHGENVDVTLIDDALQLYNDTFNGGGQAAADRAGEDVATAFDRSAEVRRRGAMRFGGVDPTSGKFAGLERKTATERATSEAGARFQARKAEEDRARGALHDASDVANRAIGQSQNFSQLSTSGRGAAARIFGDQTSDARADAAGSAALVGDIAGKIPFEKLFSGGGNGASESPAQGTLPPKPVDPDGGAYKDGGVIPGDGRRGGILKGPGTGRSDSISAVVDGTKQKVRLSSGEFIIPAHVVRKKGERFFNKMIRG